MFTLIPHGHRFQFAYLGCKRPIYGAVCDTFAEAHESMMRAVSDCLMGKPEAF